MQTQEESHALYLFRELLKAVNYCPGRTQLIKIIGQWCGDDAAAKRFIEDCFEAVEKLDDKKS